MICLYVLVVLITYPQELGKCGNLTDQKMSSLQEAEKGLTGVLFSVNSIVRSQENRQAYEELCEQVDDWKGHRKDEFGDLLHYGQFPVKKELPKSSKNTDRDVGAASLAYSCTVQVPMN